MYLYKTSCKNTLQQSIFVCLSRSLLPELTVDGLIRLLHHIEADLDTAGQDAEYYGSPILDPEEKIDLIQSVKFRACASIVI